ncbi:MAG TPA: NAD(P)H nitroreductase [Mycobacteriales bacterium]|nr:NAD(P)H nitroreductase [Mycobacteriales bacterium]
MRADLPTVIDRAGVRSAVELAVRAPSIHNTQPWIWRAGAARIDLYADRSRQLRFVDPRGRGLHVSCGAALFLLRAALRAAGWGESTSRVPNPYDPDHLATVVITGRQPAAPEWNELVVAARSRRTDRRPYQLRPITEPLIADLRTGAVVEGAFLHRITRIDERLVLAVAVGRADDYEAADLRYMAELEQWTGNDDREGIPAYAIPSPTGATCGPARDFAGARSGGLAAPRGRRSDRDALFVLATPGDSAVDQVRAGEALCHVLLMAARSGLAACPYTQPLEVPAPRLLLRRMLDGYGEPQAILRVGWPDPGDAPPLTPRRPVTDVLHWSDD